MDRTDDLRKYVGYGAYNAEHIWLGGGQVGSRRTAGGMNKSGPFDPAPEKPYKGCE